MGKSFPICIIIVSVLVHLFVLFLFYNSSSNFIDLSNGLVICKSDCSDFDRLSNTIVASGAFEAESEDPHSSVSYRGFISLIAFLKYTFGENWQSSFIFAHILLSILATLVISKLLAPRTQFALFFASMLLFNSAHLRFITYSKFLLSDFSFGILAILSFTLVATGLRDKKSVQLLLSVSLALILMFWRPTGIFVLCLILTVLSARLVSKSWRRLTILLPLLGSSICFIFVAYLAHWLGEGNLDTDGFKAGIMMNLDLIKTLNYFGHDANPELGSQVINFPYKHTIAHDGSFLSILGANLHRFSYGFEIWIDQYSLRHNLYRICFYIPVYASVLLFLAMRIVQRQWDDSLLVIVLAFSYIVLLFSVVGFEERYFSPLDMSFAIVIGVLVTRYSSNVKEYLSKLK